MQLTPLEFIKPEFFCSAYYSSKSVAGCSEARISLRALEYGIVLGVMSVLKVLPVISTSAC